MIGALTVSLFVFLFGYSRTRESEQIRIARDLMDRIVTKKKQKDAFQEGQSEDQLETYPLVYRLKDEDEVLSECHYFGYLINRKVITDQKIIDYYTPSVLEIWFIVGRRGQFIIDTMKSHKIENVYREQIDRHNNLVKSIQNFWNNTKYWRQEGY